jgi:hypothetical protein
VSTATYRTLLRTPGAAAFVFTASLGRAGIAMTSLGIVWLVHAESDSYSTAGLVTGGFAVAEGLAGPQVARLIDRRGQSAVLPAVLAVHAAAVTALVVLVARQAPVGVMVAGGVAVGATIPQLGALSAARWAALLRGHRAAELPRAFALESLSNGAAYLVGPVVVSAVGASGHPRAGSLLAAALIVGGGLIFAAQRETAPPPAPAPAVAGTTPHERSLLGPAFVMLIGINLVLGVYFGSMQVSVTAFTVDLGDAEAAAPLFAVSSVFGLIGGWLYGLRRWKSTAGRQLVVVTVGLAAACALLLLTADVPWRLGIGLAVAGLAVPPILVLCSVLAESGVHRAVLTQAFTWLNSASAAGSALAASIAGWAVDDAGAHAGFAIVTSAAAAMAVIAVIGSRGRDVRAASSRR